MQLDRRDFLATTAAASLSLSTSRLRRWLTDAPVRAITRAPKYHWFGYYDKFETDPSDRYVLGMEVDFHHRTPKPDDEIGIGMVDLHDSDKWLELGTSRAWCWQQGCMLQWRPGSRTEVLWNDRDGDRFVCRMLDVETRAQRTLPHPIYTLSPDGKTGLGIDFARLQQMRPGYGYTGVADRFAAERAPEGSGIHSVNLDTGARTDVLSLAEVVARTDPDNELREAKHYFNHLLFSPDGKRFAFLHRWRPKNKRFGFVTRMLTATPDGKDLFLLDPSGHTSHFIWRDPHHLLAWTRRDSAGAAFYVLRDRTEEATEVDVEAMPHNGHCTFLPGGDWIVNDTYPRGPDRLQTVYLYQVSTRKKVVLGRFHSPPRFAGEWRCDTHPRLGRSGRGVIIDSTHEGGGRQLYWIDIGDIVGG